jgi:hypothetical protein
MTATDLRPSLSVAEKLHQGPPSGGYNLWVINGVHHNFVMPLNKYGYATCRDEVYVPDRAEIVAKYASGKNWLVGVFLPCSATKI